MKYLILAVLPLLGLTALGTNHAWAWDRDGESIGIGEPLGPQSYDNGWQAGIQDAIFDHQQGLQYNPVGSCYSCHSELCWSSSHLISRCFNQCH